MEEKEGRGRWFTVLVGPAEMQPHLLHPRHVGHVEISQGVPFKKVKSKKCDFLNITFLNKRDRGGGKEEARIA